MSRTRYLAIASELRSLHSSMQTVSGRQSVQLRLSLLVIHQRQCGVLPVKAGYAGEARS